MSDSTKSMEKPVKHTYASKAKRKLGQANDDDGLSEHSELDGIAQVGGITGMGASKAPKSKFTEMKPPDSSHIPAPQTDGRGQSTKRVRRNPQETEVVQTKPSGKASKSTHSRASSIVVPASGSPNQMVSKPPSSKTSQTTKPLSSRRLPTSEEEEDDSSSIAESSSIRRVRRTEAERIQFLRDDPNCGDIEPHRVFCTRCDSWVNLGKRQTYLIRSWELHRKRCDNTSQRVESAEDDDGDATSVVAPSVRSERAERKCEQERQAILQTDSRAGEVRHDEVLCKKCDKRIKLSNKTRFALGNWTAHQRRCSESLPSHRVAVAERKLKLVNDAQVEAFSTHSVSCALCHESIALDGLGDYNLTTWEEHKLRCCRPIPVAQNVPAIIDATSKTLETSSSQSPPSVASTDGTVVASDTSPSRTGEKRAREGGSEDDDRPLNRQRTSTYISPEEEAPSPWGWFLYPLKTFVRGFREGMGGSG